jgi:hypothetical protein
MGQAGRRGSLKPVLVARARRHVAIQRRVQGRLGRADLLETCSNKRHSGRRSRPGLRPVGLRLLADAVSSREGGPARCAKPSRRAPRLLLVPLVRIAPLLIERSVATRAAVTGCPHEQRVCPVMAMRTPHPLVHQQPFPSPNWRMPGSSLLQTVLASGERHRAARVDYSVSSLPRVVKRPCVVLPFALRKTSLAVSRSLD